MPNLRDLQTSDYLGARITENGTNRTYRCTMWWKTKSGVRVYVKADRLDIDGFDDGVYDATHANFKNTQWYPQRPSGVFPKGWFSYYEGDEVVGMSSEPFHRVAENERVVFNKGEDSYTLLSPSMHHWLSSAPSYDYEIALHMFDLAEKRPQHRYFIVSYKTYPIEGIIGEYYEHIAVNDEVIGDYDQSQLIGTDDADFISVALLMDVFDSIFDTKTGTKIL